MIIIIRDLYSANSAPAPYSSDESEALSATRQMQL